MYNISIKKQYIILFFIHTLSLISIFTIQYFASLNNFIYKNAIIKCMHKCFYYDKSPIINKLTLSRGHNYYALNNVGDNLNKRKYCLITPWGFSHCALHIIIGLYCPNLFVPSLIVGVLWEIIEHITVDCADLLDIGFNSIGFGIGYVLNKLILEKYDVTKKSIIIVLFIIFIIFIYIFKKIKDIYKEINENKEEEEEYDEE